MTDMNTQDRESAQILVVDDTPENLKLLKEMLTNNGYRVRPASNGRLALKSVSAQSPDLILLDVRMPDMDGYEVCNRLKSDERSRGIPVIFISALDSVADKVRGFEAGGVDFITKPFHEAEVLARVETHLSLLRLHKRLESQNVQLHTEIAERERFENELTVHQEHLEELITERTRELKEALDNYRGIFVNSVEGIFRTSPEGRFISCNPAMADILGYESPEEMRGENDDIMSKLYVHPRRRQELFAMLSTGRDAKNFEVELYRKDGTILSAILNNRPFFDEQGNLLFIDGTLRDVTEHKRAQESLYKLSQAVEQSPVSIIITDINGVVEFVNSKYIQLSGFSFDDAVGAVPNILNAETTSPEVHKTIWKTITGGNVWEGEFQNRKKKGEFFSERATISPIRNKEGVISHFLVIEEDISERKLLEQQLLQAQKMESMGRLAGGVAHDFNNMLNVILGYAEMALLKTDPSSPIHRYLREITDAGLRSADLARQLLAFARKQTIVPRVLDLNDTVAGMLKMLMRLVGEEIDLLWKPSAELWPVNMDPAQVDQILANLVVNARDAISSVGRITIETGMVEFDQAYSDRHDGFVPGRYVLLAVSDDGCGMDKETQTRLFEPFFTTKEVGKGTGLGLATVYGIVRQNSGFINVYSEPGKGSIFRIYLPRHESEQTVAEETSEAAEAPTGTETVLLVEDEDSLLDLATQLLAGLGYTVLAASGPNRALRLAEEFRGEIHLLLTDVIMPEMSGRELLERLAASRPNLKSLYMSGYTAEVIAHHGVLHEGVHFLQKPFSAQDLAVKLREALNG
jgi:PAS domain S-box-containing protein